MQTDPYSLADLGWSAEFLRQLSAREAGALTPARVTTVHRDRIGALSEAGPLLLSLPTDLSAGDIAVGDWVLADGARITRLLDRKTRLTRRAAGETSREQLIVANVDTVFLTTSCNAEFNEARLERYLALIHSGGIPPVLVLTKPDMADDPENYADRLRRIAPALPVITLDARDPDAANALRDWCGRGQTVAFLGSSGVGKSTLVSALTGSNLATNTIREDDARGRHTTTARELHPLPGGGWLIDTPGMRELRLSDVGEGIDETFAEISDLLGQCRFTDCEHESEPGCAVQQAIADGRIDPDRLTRWRKLRREDAHNTASLAERRQTERATARVHRRIKRARRDRHKPE